MAPAALSPRAEEWSGQPGEGSYRRASRFGAVSRCAGLEFGQPIPWSGVQRTGGVFEPRRNDCLAQIDGIGTGSRPMPG